jgi:hypothetical protein
MSFPLRPLYIAGVVTGLVVATLSALGPLRTGPLPRDAVARVDGVDVPRSTYEAAVAGLVADKRNPVSAGDRKLALDRLVDEELLVQRGLALGLAESEGSVRKALVDAMLQFAASEATGREPSDAELKAFYDARPMMFARSPQLRLAVASVAARSRAEAQLRAALRGGAGFADAAHAAGAQFASLPDGYLGASKITDYAGPAARDAALGLRPGQVGGPITAGNQALFVWLIDARPGERMPFDSVRPQVLEAWRSDVQDHALDTYLADLRRRASVQLAPDAQ